jgi:glycosyltransferase involved in cell wall biosynthesis
MSANRLYYQLKPYLPWRLRMGLRRVIARRQRKAYQDVWPINEAAGSPPAGWPGWPEGKKFAFVLTHDVEGPAGLAKCRQLMALEQKLGFRSSFNFIPEGDYAVSRELREELVQNGFEVGVHDLHHDGKLYESQQAFTENARWINHYLKEWGACGFRGGFMMRQLDWIHDLNIQYDASTFDTDPFEPQPDGAGTIFPFWISRPLTQPMREGVLQTREGYDAQKSATRSHLPGPRPQTLSPTASRPGYVELPYTLAQDSTLFLVLREPTPEIWLRKLDWIVQHGGMALLNVHPDYLRFPGEPASPRTFPVAHYFELLEYVRDRYAGVYWQPLPKRIAEWYGREILPASGRAGENGVAIESESSKPSSSSALRGKHAAVVIYSEIVSDARPRRELEALLDAGMTVDVICLQEKGGSSKTELRGPLHVTRIPIRHDRFRKTSYLRNYGYFFLRAFFCLAGRSFTRRYDLVHVHNMPDALVFAALVPRLAGAKIVLDLHDPMPELYQTIYGMQPDSGMVRLLQRLEKWSIRFAHLVLTPNEAFRRVFCSRSCPPCKVSIVVNTPDENIFKPVSPGSPPEQVRDPRREFRVMYHGLIVERHGLRTAIEAVRRLSPDLPGIVLDLFGEQNAFLDEIMGAARETGLNGRIRYQGQRRLDDIPAAIAAADLGIIPNLRTPFTEINFPTRIFEYLALGKPVIAPDTRGIRDYFDDTQIIFFKPGDTDDLARAIWWVYEHPEAVATFVANGREVYKQHLWTGEKSRFLNSLESLFHQPSSGSRLG